MYETSSEAATALDEVGQLQRAITNGQCSDPAGLAESISSRVSGVVSFLIVTGSDDHDIYTQIIEPLTYWSLSFAPHFVDKEGDLADSYRSLFSSMQRLRERFSHLQA